MERSEKERRMSTNQTPDSDAQKIEQTPPQEPVVDVEIDAQAPEPEQDPIEVLNKEIEALQNQLAQNKTDLLRAYADTDNTRKRLIKETEMAKKYRFQSAALELLPILDNLNRALAVKPENPELANYVRGFEMIQTQLENALKNEGVVEIDALDQPFDANLMQAIATEKVDGKEPGLVSEVLQKGYKLKDRLLRPALVKVSE